MDKLKQLLTKWNDGQFRGAIRHLAQELGVNPPAVSMWISGRTNPSEKNIAKMAQLFNISKEQVTALFLNRDAELSSIGAIPLTDKNTISLPILADVPAGLPEFSDKDVELFIDIPRFMFAGADFIVKCNGDSLEPKLHKGDYCVIRKMEEPINGRAMVVRTENGVCMKVIKKLKDGAVQLCSLNPKYKPFIPAELVIVGLIIGTWSRMDRESLLGE